MTDPRSYDLIPSETMGGLRRYVDYGVPAGHFLMAVLENDLFQACAHADTPNMEGLIALVTWIYNREPHGCYGSRKIVDSWMSHDGLNGHQT